MSFEWDPDKAEQNFVKHRIDFADTIQLFDGDHFTYRSDRDDEERHVAVGLVGGLIVAVVWTPRGAGVRRIISARRARDGEKDRYRKSFGSRS